MKYLFEETDSIDEMPVEALESLEARLFSSSYQPLKLTHELRLRTAPLLHFARESGHLVAFKLAYRLSSETLMSWVGGTHPDHRGQGLARELMRRQHLTAKSFGYRKVRTTCRNRFKPMLLLNLSEGFDIVGTVFQEDEKDISIVLEKILS